MGNNDYFYLTNSYFLYSRQKKTAVLNVTNTTDSMYFNDFWISHQLSKDEFISSVISKSSRRFGFIQFLGVTIKIRAIPAKVFNQDAKLKSTIWGLLSYDEIKCCLYFIDCIDCSRWSCWMRNSEERIFTGWFPTKSQVNFLTSDGHNTQ